MVLPGAVGLGVIMGAIFLSIALAVRHFSESLPADAVHLFFNFGIIAAPVSLILYPLLAAGFIRVRPAAMGRETSARF